MARPHSRLQDTMMALLKIGDRSPQVAQVQQTLNARPSKLPRLTIDGSFGMKTKARVIEFQRDNNLKADGIVGDLTLSKLNGSGGRSPAEVANFIRERSFKLPASERSAFVAQVQPLASNPALLANVEVLPIIIVIALLFIMTAMALQSRDPNMQRMGREWQRRGSRLIEQIKGSSDSAAVSAAVLSETRARARELAADATSRRDECQSRLTPQKLQNCARLFAQVTLLIQALGQKAGTAIGGGITPESLIEGINRNSGELIQALRDLGNCTGCDNLFL